MANRFGQIGLGGLDRVVEGFASSQMRGERRRKGAFGPVRMRRVDELTFEDVEEPSVIKQVGRPFRKQMTALDQDVLAAEPVNHFRGAARVGQRLDLDTGKLLGLVYVRRDQQRQRKELLL